MDEVEGNPLDVAIESSRAAAAANQYHEGAWTGTAHRPPSPVQDSSGTALKEMAGISSPRGASVNDLRPAIAASTLQASLKDWSLTNGRGIEIASRSGVPTVQKKPPIPTQAAEFTMPDLSGASSDESELLSSVRAEFEEMKSSLLAEKPEEVWFL